MIFTDEQIKLIDQLIDEKIATRRIKLFQSDIPAKTIKLRHIEDVVIVFGVSADRPENDLSGVKSYFATDTGVLSCWDGTQWLETTLS